jgi:Tol biopolymer transport system component
MDPLSKLRTSLATRYDIEREIGAGGMATVYLARDQRHDRNVALKVLNPELGAVLGVERFLSEIKVTANLQHPNLLPLFDSGEADGLLFYVMPFVEGETLRHRLDREKQLPIDEAIRIAVAVANALDYAHSHHVIHRDLKPENILLQHGQPVVADFGIALAVSKAGGNRVTQTGLSLGTPQYMSPEQATGDRVIDGRTDIYSLGALTYEMLTGEPPHIGHTSQAIIARLLTDKPRSVRTSRPAVPEHVDATIQRALEKLPADRFSTAKEFADALQGRGGLTIGTGATSVPAPATPSRSRWRDPVTLWLAGVAVAAIAFAALARGRKETVHEVPPIRFILNAADSLRPLDNFPWPAAISPDGRSVVFSVGQRGQGTTFYLQRTDQLEARPIPGTLGAYQPYFSPDGEWLAFQAAGKERKVRLDGSAPVTISDGGSANGADWTINDEIISGANLGFNGLGRVNAAGGVMTQFTFPDTSKREKQHLWPVALPDGEHVVFVIWYGNLESSRLAVASLSDGRISELGVNGIRPLAVLDGRVVYIQSDGTVMAVALDADNGRVTGSPIPVHDPVPVGGVNNGNSGAYISRAGALVTSRGTVRSQLTWLARDGNGRQVIVPEVRSYSQPLLSPDERRVVLLVTDNLKSDVWVYEFATRTFTRLTTNGTVTSVEWSADGQHVIYAGRGERERTAFWRQSPSGGSAAERLLELDELAPVLTGSSDGQWLVFQAYDNNTWNLFKTPVDSTKGGRTPYISTPANEQNPRFSPDGKWVAFLSDESGRSEVYVRSFPDPTSRVQVSAEGAQEVVWSDDGKRIYYRSGGSLLAAAIEHAPAFRVVRRDTLVTTQMPPAIGFGASYDVTRDGRILTLFSSRDDFELVVSPNWLTEFRARIAASERNRK